MSATAATSGTEVVASASPAQSTDGPHQSRPEPELSQSISPSTPPPKQQQHQPSLRQEFSSPSRVPPALLSRPELEDEVKQQRIAIKALLQFKSLIEQGASSDESLNSFEPHGLADAEKLSTSSSSSFDTGSANVAGVQQRLHQLRAANKKEMALQDAEARAAKLDEERAGLTAELESRAGALAALQATEEVLAAQLGNLRHEMDVSTAAVSAAVSAREKAEEELRAAAEEAGRERAACENTIATLRMALAGVEQTETSQADQLCELENSVHAERKAHEQLTARLHDQTERAAEHAAAVRRKHRAAKQLLESSRRESAERAREAQAAYRRAQEEWAARVQEHNEQVAAIETAAQDAAAQAESETAALRGELVGELETARVNQEKMRAMQAHLLESEALLQDSGELLQQKETLWKKEEAAAAARLLRQEEALVAHRRQEEEHTVAWEAELQALQLRAEEGLARRDAELREAIDAENAVLEAVTKQRDEAIAAVRAELHNAEVEAAAHARDRDAAAAAAEAALKLELAQLVGDRDEQLTKMQAQQQADRSAIAALREAASEVAAQAEARIAEIRSEAAEAQEAAKAGADSTILAAEAQLQHVQEELQLSEANALAATARLEEVQQALKQAEASKADIALKARELEDEVRGVKALAAEQERLASDEAAKLSSEHQQTVEVLSERVLRAEVATKAEKDRADRAEAECVARSQELENLQNSFASAQAKAQVAAEEAAAEIALLREQARKAEADHASAIQDAASRAAEQLATAQAQARTAESEHMSTTAALRETVAALQAKLASAQDQQKVARADKDAYVEGLQSTMGDLRAEVARLETQVALGAEQASKVEAGKDEVIATLRSSLEALQAKTLELDQRVHNSGEQLEVLRADKASALAVRDGVAEELRGTIAKMNTQLNQAERDRDRALADKQNEIVGLQGQVDRLEVRNTDLAAQLEREQDNTAHQQSLVIDLHAQMQQVQALGDKALEAKNVALDTASAELENARNALEERDTTVAELEKQLEDCGKELQAAKADAMDMRRRLEVTERERSQLSRDMDGFRDTAGESAAAAAAERTKLLDSCAAADRRVSELEEMLSQSEAEMAQLKQEVEHLNAKLRDASEELAQLHDDAKNRDENIAQLQKLLAEAKAVATDWETKASEASERAEKGDADRDALSLRLQSVQSELQVASEKLLDLETQLLKSGGASDSSAGATDIVAGAESAQAHDEDVGLRFQQAQDEIKKLEARLEQEREAHRMADSALHSARSHADALTDQLREAHDRIVELKQRIDQESQKSAETSNEAATQLAELQAALASAREDLARTRSHATDCDSAVDVSAQSVLPPARAQSASAASLFGTLESSQTASASAASRPAAAAQLFGSAPALAPIPGGSANSLFTSAPVSASNVAASLFDQSVDGRDSFAIGDHASSTKPETIAQRDLTNVPDSNQAARIKQLETEQVELRFECDSQVERIGELERLIDAQQEQMDAKQSALDALHAQSSERKEAADANLVCLQADLQRLTDRNSELEQQLTLAQQNVTEALESKEKFAAREAELESRLASSVQQVKTLQESTVLQKEPAKSSSHAQPPDQPLHFADLRVTTPDRKSQKAAAAVDLWTAAGRSDPTSASPSAASNLFAAAAPGLRAHERPPRPSSGASALFGGDSGVSISNVAASAMFDAPGPAASNGDDGFNNPVSQTASSAQVETMEARLAECQAALHKSESTVRSLENSVRELTTRSSQLAKHLEDAHTKLKKFEAQAVGVTDTRTSPHELNQKTVVSSVSAHASALFGGTATTEPTRCGDASSLFSGNPRGPPAFDASQVDVQNLQQMLRLKTQDCEQQSAELDQLRQEVADNARRHASAAKSHDELQQQLIATRHELQNVRGKLDHANKVEKNLRSEIELLGKADEVVATVEDQGDIPTSTDTPRTVGADAKRSNSAFVPGSSLAASLFQSSTAAADTTGATSSAASLFNAGGVEPKSPTPAVSSAQSLFGPSATSQTTHVHGDASAVLSPSTHSFSSNSQTIAAEMETLKEKLHRAHQQLHEAGNVNTELEKVQLEGQSLRNQLEKLQQQVYTLTNRSAELEDELQTAEGKHQQLQNEVERRALLEQQLRGELNRLNEFANKAETPVSLRQSGNTTGITAQNSDDDVRMGSSAAALFGTAAPTSSAAAASLFGSEASQTSGAPAAASLVAGMQPTSPLVNAAPAASLFGAPSTEDGGSTAVETHKSDMRVENLVAQLEQKQDELNQLKADAAHQASLSVSTIEELRQDCQQMREQAAQSASELDDAYTKLHDAETAQETVQNDLNSMQSRHHEDTRTLHARIEELVAQIAGLESERDNARQEAVESKGAVARSADELDTLQNELQNVRQHLTRVEADLTLAVTDLDTSKSEVKALKNQLETERTALVAAHSAVSSKEDALADALAQRASMEKLLEAEQDRAKELEESLEKFTTERSELTPRHSARAVQKILEDEARAAQEDLDAERARNKEAAAQLTPRSGKEVLRQELLEVRLRLNAFEVEAANATDATEEAAIAMRHQSESEMAELTNVRAVVDELSLELSAATRQRESVEQEVAAAYAQREAAQTELRMETSMFEESLSVAEGTSRDLEEQLAKARAQWSLTQNELTGFVKELQNTESEASEKLAAESAALSSALNATETHLQQARLDLASADERVQSATRLESELATARQSVVLAQEAHAAIEQELAEARVAHESELAALRAQANELEATLQAVEAQAAATSAVGTDAAASTETTAESRELAEAQAATEQLQAQLGLIEEQCRQAEADAHQAREQLRIQAERTEDLTLRLTEAEGQLEEERARAATVMKSLGQGSVLPKDAVEGKHDENIGKRTDGDAHSSADGSFDEESAHSDVDGIATKESAKENRVAELEVALAREEARCEQLQAVVRECEIALAFQRTRNGIVLSGLQNSPLAPLTGIYFPVRQGDNGDGDDQTSSVAVTAQAFPGANLVFRRQNLSWNQVMYLYFQVDRWYVSPNPGTRAGYLMGKVPPRDASTTFSFLEESSISFNNSLGAPVDMSTMAVPDPTRRDIAWYQFSSKWGRAGDDFSCRPSPYTPEGQELLEAERQRVEQLTLQLQEKEKEGLMRQERGDQQTKLDTVKEEAARLHSVNQGNNPADFDEDSEDNERGPDGQSLHQHEDKTVVSGEKANELSTSQPQAPTSATTEEHLDSGGGVSAQLVAEAARRVSAEVLADALGELGISTEQNESAAAALAELSPTKRPTRQHTRTQIHDISAAAQLKHLDNGANTSDAGRGRPGVNAADAPEDDASIVRLESSVDYGDFESDSDSSEGHNAARAASDTAATSDVAEAVLDQRMQAMSKMYGAFDGRGGHGAASSQHSKLSRNTLEDSVTKAGEAPGITEPFEVGQRQHQTRNSITAVPGESSQPQERSGTQILLAPPNRDGGDDGDDLEDTWSDMSDTIVTADLGPDASVSATSSRLHTEDLRTAMQDQLEHESASAALIAAAAETAKDVVAMEPTQKDGLVSRLQSSPRPPSAPPSGGASQKTKKTPHPPSRPPPTPHGTGSSGSRPSSAGASSRPSSASGKRCRPPPRPPSTGRRRTSNGSARRTGPRPPPPPGGGIGNRGRRAPAHPPSAGRGAPLVTPEVQVARRRQTAQPLQLGFGTPTPVPTPSRKDLRDTTDPVAASSHHGATSSTSVPENDDPTPTVADTTNRGSSKQKLNSFFEEDEDDSLLSASSSIATAQGSTKLSASSASTPGNGDAKANSSASSSWFGGFGRLVSSSVGKMAGALRRRPSPNIKTAVLKNESKAVYIEGRGWVFDGEEDTGPADDPGKAPPPTSMPSSAGGSGAGAPPGSARDGDGHSAQPSALDAMMAPPSAAGRYHKPLTGLDALMAPPSAAGRYGIGGPTPGTGSSPAMTSANGPPPS
eukprot:INCI7183.4.p1 GENE.INCI7183.4~~INCI7183.4.p1  ORF type:complete len:3997 (+),score=938.85 INCI7183.4:220-11991(+)